MALDECFPLSCKLPMKRAVIPNHQQIFDLRLESVLWLQMGLTVTIELQ